MGARYGAVTGRWMNWALAAATGVLAGCDTEPTPYPFPPDVRVADATDEQRKLACQGLRLSRKGHGATLTIGTDKEAVRIRAARGTHNIEGKHLQQGRMTARIDIRSGPGIPDYGMQPLDTACLLIVGESYHDLETRITSFKTGATLATLFTPVIHKARKHEHPEADWIAVAGGSLGRTRSGDNGPRGMIPWLFQARTTLKFLSQQSCGRYHCCVQSNPK